MGMPRSLQPLASCQVSVLLRSLPYDHECACYSGCMSYSTAALSISHLATRLECLPVIDQQISPDDICTCCTGPLPWDDVLSSSDDEMFSGARGDYLPPRQQRLQQQRLQQEELERQRSPSVEGELTSV